MSIYDKKGIPILPGDLIKVYHFKDRKGIHYMYKYAHRIETVKGQEYLVFKHLNVRGEEFLEPIDERILGRAEIVQGYGNSEFGGSFKSREKKKKI